MNRTKLLLCILLPCFAASLLYAVVRMPRQRMVDHLTYPPQHVLSPRKPAPGSDSRRTDAAQQPADTAAVTVRRDLFAPFKPTKSAKQLRRPPSVAPPPTPQEIVHQQLRNFRFLGTFIRQNVPIAFLARGDQVLLVRVGDKLYDGYQVSAITPDALTVHAIQGNDTITLQLN